MIYIAHRWRDRNLSRLELVVVLLLFVLFVFFILQRAINVFAVAEKNYLDYTVANIDTALRLQSLVYFSTNKLDELDDIVNTNPMRFMELQETDELKSFYEDTKGAKQAIEQLYSIQPSNYIGELFRPELDSLKKGSWYFDLELKKLVYIVINAERFFTELEGKKRIIFSVVFDYEDVNGDGVFEEKIDIFNRLFLQADNQYEWLN